MRAYSVGGIGRGLIKADDSKRPEDDVAPKMTLACNLPIVQLRFVSDNKYRGGTTEGSKWGCGIAAVVTTPLFFIFMIADALGDCVPNVECKKSFAQFVLLPSVVIALGLFFAVRFVVNRFGRSDRES